MSDNKKYEEHIVPDDYTDMQDGNANTDSDAVFGDFVYEQRKVGNRTQNFRRAIITDQIDPAPYPENTANPFVSPEDMEMQNGTHANQEELPSLQSKIDEAEAILASEGNSTAREKDKERDEER